MEAAVSTLLTEVPHSVYSVGRVWRLTVLVRLQTEPEDRFSGRRRSPQQPESLADKVAGYSHNAHQPVIARDCGHFFVNGSENLSQINPFRLLNVTASITV